MRLASFAFAFALLLAVTDCVEAREWSDATGKFKIEAELDDVAGDAVKLKKPSGEIVSVPLAKLSKADKDHVAKALSLASSAQAVLRQHCYSCHGQNGVDEGGMNFVLNAKRLAEKEKLVPGQPDKSALLSRVVAGEMPPAEVKARPSAAHVETLRDWIAAGAFAPSEVADRSFIPVSAILDAIAADLNAADERSRVYYRYFTLTHLYNSGLNDDELHTVRLALAKLLNSLSWDRKIIAPQPVDPAETVFRIDVRDLRWTRELWDALASAYPYGVEHSGKTAADCYRLSGTKVPFLRADWFVAGASRPPLYHALLVLPETLGELQNQLKLSFAQNLRQDRAIRAGFTNSGVSQNPRVIERHETADGACWVSYDFAGAAGARNFFNEPLAFEFDGNEVIFNLPNGLLAFMIFDREGNRIDKAPTNMVRDLQSPDASVVNGISCVRCHADGIIPKQDEVRSHAVANKGAFGERLKIIQALYPEPKALQEAFHEDQERYREAIAKLGVTRASAAGEPIYNTARRFREPLDLRRASAEVGRTSADFQGYLNRLVSLQRQVGPLRVAGGTVPREVFEQAFGSLVGPMEVGRHVAPVARIRAPEEAVASSDAGDSAPAEESSPAPPSDDASAVAAAAGGAALSRGADMRHGIAHQWKLDESKGNLARDTQGRNNASLGNWDAEDPRWVPGKIGRALQFSRPEHIALIGRDMDYPQMTISFWIQVQLERGTNPRVVHPWVSLNYEKGLGVCVLGRVTEPTKPTIGEWVHYAVTIDQARHVSTIYRDGDEVASGKIEAERERGLWVLGHNADPRNHGDTLNGLLDDVRVYKRILTPEDVAKLARYGVAE
jgi:mono/diheme cytochrome c family protein